VGSRTDRRPTVIREPARCEALDVGPPTNHVAAGWSGTNRDEGRLFHRSSFHHVPAAAPLENRRRAADRRLRPPFRRAAPTTLGRELVAAYPPRAWDDGRGPRALAGDHRGCVRVPEPCSSPRGDVRLAAGPDGLPVRVRPTGPAGVGHRPAAGQLGRLLTGPKVADLYDTFQGLRLTLDDAQAACPARNRPAIWTAFARSWRRPERPGTAALAGVHGGRPSRSQRQTVRRETGPFTSFRGRPPMPPVGEAGSGDRTSTR
jgi:hypothetical protein